MCKTIIYKLEPRASFHIGERGVGIERTSEIVHSDTLFAAIVCAWRALGEEMDGKGNMNLLKPFFSDPDQPPFRLSSAFPYVKDVLLLPAPLTKPGHDKKLKKVEFLSRSVLTSGKLGDSAEMQSGKVRLTYDEKKRVLDGSTDPDREFIWKSGHDAVVPRVTVDRISSASEIYHCGTLLFSEGCGIYFWVELRDESYEKYLNRAVDFLSEEGIGGERSSGHGQFSYEGPKGEKLPAMNGDEAYMTLSLYHPTCAEVRDGALDDAAYNLVNCRGWIYSPDGGSQRRRTVRMITEGSVLSRPVMGNIKDVSPDTWDHHPVYRYGLALTIPVLSRWEVRDDG